MTPAALAITALLVIQSPLEEAVYREVALGETEEALAAYAEILRDLETPSEVQARTLHRLAVCHAKVGNPGEARSALSDLAFRFRDMPEVNNRARAEVARHIGMHGLVMTLAGATGDEARQAARTLACLAPESVPALEGALESWDPLLRRRAAVTLWEICDASGFDTLAEAVMQEGPAYPIFENVTVGDALSNMVAASSDLRERAEDLLRATEGDPSRGRILQAVAGVIGDSPGARQVARDLLSTPGFEDTAWTYLLHHSSPEEVLEAACIRVASMGPGDSLTVLRSLRDRAEGDPRFRPLDSDRLFREILARSDPEMLRVIAPELHLWIGRPWGISADVALDLANGVPGKGAGAMMDRLVTLATRESWIDEIRPRCIDLYCRLTSSDAIGEFRERVRRLEALARDDPAGEERVLRAALRNGGPWLRWGWVHQLSVERPEFWGRFLRESMDEDDSSTLLRWIQDHGGSDRIALLEAFADRWPSRDDGVVNGLRQMRDPSAVGLVLRFLGSRSALTRRDAIYTLAYYGAREAADEIRPFLDDLDSGVRDAAAFALDQFRRMDEEPARWRAWYESR